MTVFLARKPSTAEALVLAIGAPAEVSGDGARAIASVASLDDVGAGGLAFCNAGPEDIAARLARADGGTIITSAAAATAARELLGRLTLIAVPDPRRYFIRAFNHLVAPEIVRQKGVAATATIHKNAKLAGDVSVGPGAFIDRDVEIGVGSTVFGGVQIFEGTHIGRNVVIQANCSIGSHGQSYERDDDGRFILMPHFSNVVIGDEVIVGANTTIVRGTLQDTVIGARTIVGNNACIGHNVVVGENAHVGAGVILCGSSRIGDRSWISIAAVIKSVPIGAGAMVGPGAMVTRAVEEGQMVNGFPARVTAKVNNYNEVSGR